MSKVICDICGTVYQDTAECCPICGCARGSNTEVASEDLFLDEELTDSVPASGKGGRFSAANVKKKKKEIFDFDAMNSQGKDPEEDESEEIDENLSDDEEEDGEEPRTNTFLVVLLTILIVLLLLAAGFILFRYFLPNITSRNNDAGVTTGAAQVTQPRIEETTEPAIPCQSIVLIEGIPELNKDGKWLLHVLVMPEDTTDLLVYESADESIATVNEEGRVTAVAEGETTIYITCGMQQINCKVVVRFVEETEPPTEEPVQTAPEETVEATEAGVEEPVEEIQSESEETVAETKPLEALADVVLKLKRTDVTITEGYSFQLELDCDLKPEDVEWSVEHEYIAKVDNGYVTALRSGTTAVIVKYGDQQVQCIVRCRAR